jgi:hypothetical protein
MTHWVVRAWRRSNRSEVPTGARHRRPQRAPRRLFRQRPRPHLWRGRSALMATYNHGFCTRCIVRLLSTATSAVFRNPACEARGGYRVLSSE